MPLDISGWHAAGANPRRWNAQNDHNGIAGSATLRPHAVEESCKITLMTSGINYVISGINSVTCGINSMISGMISVTSGINSVTSGINFMMSRKWRTFLKNSRKIRLKQRKNTQIRSSINGGRGDAFPLHHSVVLAASEMGPMWLQGCESCHITRLQCDYRGIALSLERLSASLKVYILQDFEYFRWFARYLELTFSRDFKNTYKSVHHLNDTFSRRCLIEMRVWVDFGVFLGDFSRFWAYSCVFRCILRHFSGRLKMHHVDGTPSPGSLPHHRGWAMSGSYSLYLNDRWIAYKPN